MIFQAEIKKSVSCEVLVIGGGVAGYGAAVGAATQGADVILAEENGYLGGCATAGLVAPFMTCMDKKGENQIIKGAYDELVRKMVALNAAKAPEDCCKCDSYSGYKLKGHLGTVPFDKETLKFVMEQTCLEKGVRLKYHFKFVQAEKKGRKITACIFATKNGFYRIEAKTVIDCTGDAAVCYNAGGECVFSDENGSLQPVTTFFLIDGVDKEKLDKMLLDNPSAEERAFMAEVKKAKENGEFPCGTQKVRVYEQLNGIWSVNMCQIDNPFDVNDPDLLSDAEVEGRKQVQSIFRFLKKYVPCMENIRLLQTSESIGIRESRRIVGEYVLTLDDLHASKDFKDKVAVLANSVDVHTSGAVNYKTFQNDAPYTLPYRCLVHKDFDNVLSAGKSVSADRFAHGAVRVMPPSMAMGQAAGIAAAIAVQTGVTAKDVNYEQLKTALKDQGAYL